MAHPLTHIFLSPEFLAEVRQTRKSQIHYGKWVFNDVLYWLNNPGFHFACGHPFRRDEFLALPPDAEHEEIRGLIAKQLSEYWSFMWPHLTPDLSAEPIPGIAPICGITSLFPTIKDVPDCKYVRKEEW